MAQALPQKPKPHMSNGKTVFTIALAVVLDGLKLLCDFLFLTGPVIAGVAAEVYANGHGLSWLPTGLVTTVVGAAGTVAGLGSGVGEALEIFGLILSMAIAFMGWLIFILFVIGPREIFKNGSRLMTTLIGFLCSEVPFLNAGPTFTVPITRIVFNIRKEDRENLMRFKAANDAEEAAQAKQIQAFMAQKAQNDSTVIPEYEQMAA